MHEPVHPLLEPRQLLDHFILQDQAGKEWDETNHGAHTHHLRVAVGMAEMVVVEAILIIPEALPCGQDSEGKSEGNVCVCLHTSQPNQWITDNYIHYRGTSLQWTPLGPSWLSCIERCP